MQTSVTFKNIDASDHLKSYVGDKLDRFDKYLDNPAEASVVLLAFASLVVAWRSIGTPLPLAPALSEVEWPGETPYLIGDFQSATWRFAVKRD